MSEILDRAIKAARPIFRDGEDWPAIMRAALLAALDPEDEALEEIVNRGLDGVPSGKSAIAAIRDHILAGTDDAT